MFETICSAALLVLLAIFALVAVVYVTAMLAGMYMLHKELEAWSDFEDDE